uniref:Peptidase A1 domain-containing protein n=1 Tax=Acrobeloides nanus TaxID=290746 RepID=A0A914CZ31_9BILA
MKNTLIDGNNAGAVTWGGLDTDNCGNVIAYQPLSSTTYYQFSVSSMSYGTFSSGTTVQTISDTGYLGIVGPQPVIQVMATLVNAAYNNE